MPRNSFKLQWKNGKGVKTKDDLIMSTISTNTIDNLLLFTKKGKMFNIILDEIPVGKYASKGADVGTLINMAQDDEMTAITSLERNYIAKYKCSL